MLTDTQKKKKASGICVTPFCTKKRGGRSLTCYSCKKKKFQKDNPEKYCYQVWQNNCKGRKKVNTVSFPQFLIFLKDNPDYMNKKGTRVKSLQIDRDKECNSNCPKEWCYEHGYHAHTIQAITLRENRYKYDKSRGRNVSNYSDVPF
jgi:hypothetical protein